MKLQLYTRMGITMGGLMIVYLLFLGALSMYFSTIIIPLMFAALFLGVQYFYSDKLALKSSKAKIVSEKEYPELHQMVTRLSMQADIPKPKVAVSKANMANAFATGRNKNNAVVCVTEELMKELSQEELKAVIAHELAHIKNRDVAVMTIASFFSTIAFFIARYGIYGNTRDGRIFVAIAISFIVWIISTLLIKSLSRYREYAADRGAASITGEPLELVSALRKITNTNNRKPEKDMREQEGLNAFYISSISKSKFASLLSTHPKPEKRIEALEKMEKQKYK